MTARERAQDLSSRQVAGGSAAQERSGLETNSGFIGSRGSLVTGGVGLSAVEKERRSLAQDSEEPQRLRHWLQILWPWAGEAAGLVAVLYWKSS